MHWKLQSLSYSIRTTGYLTALARVLVLRQVNVGALYPKRYAVIKKWDSRVNYLGDYCHLIEFPNYIGQIMPSPPIAIFLTTIASQAALRQRQGMFSRLSQRAGTKVVAFEADQDNRISSSYSPSKEDSVHIL